MATSVKTFWGKTADAVKQAMDAFVATLLPEQRNSAKIEGPYTNSNEGTADASPYEGKVRWETGAGVPQQVTGPQQSELEGRYNPGALKIGPERTAAWNNLITQLQGRAAGLGPSVANQQYVAQQQGALAQQAGAMGSGNRLAMAQAPRAMLATNQQLAQQAASARTQEQMQAIGALSGAVSGADKANLQREAANVEAQMRILEQMTGLTKAQLDAVIQKYGIDKGAPGWEDKVLNAAFTAIPIIASLL